LRAENIRLRVEVNRLRRSRARESAPRRDSFNWLGLQDDIKRHVFGHLSMQDMLVLQDAVRCDVCVSGEIERRIALTRPLWRAWAARRAGAVEHTVAMDVWTNQSRKLESDNLWNLQHHRHPSHHSRSKLTPPSTFMNLRLMDLRQSTVPLLPAVWNGLQFVKVECLALAEVALDSLPDSLASACPGLRALSLVSNEFRSFPIVVLALKRLQYLSVSDNPSMGGLPTSIGDDLKELRTLHATRCGLRDLPPSLLQALQSDVCELKEFVALDNRFPLEYQATLESVQERAWRIPRFFGWRRQDWPRYRIQQSGEFALASASFPGQ